VHEHRDAPRRRDAEDVDHFPTRRARRIDQPHADANRPRVELVLQPRAQCLALSVPGNGLRPALACRHNSGHRGVAAERAYARPWVAGGGAEVDWGLALAVIVKRRHVGCANFEVERRRDPLLGREAIGRRVVDVGVEVDETG
jgi:hypothetical protein